MQAIELDSVSRTFTLAGGATFTALQDVSFSVGIGEVVGYSA